MKPHNLHQSVSSTFTFPFSWSKTFLLLGGGGRHGNPWENNFYCSASFLENFLIVYKYLFLDIFYLWLKLPKMYCFVQNVILFLCIEKLLCKMHLCKIDFWLIWVIFQDMIRRMIRIRWPMFPVYCRVIKAWLVSSCAPLLLLHQRPVLFCVCFKKFKHIGLEGGWAGLGWSGLARGFRWSPGVEAAPDSWQFSCFQSSLQTPLVNCFRKNNFRRDFHSH